MDDDRGGVYRPPDFTFRIDPDRYPDALRLMIDFFMSGQIGSWNFFVIEVKSDGTVRVTFTGAPHVRA